MLPPESGSMLVSAADRIPGSDPARSGNCCADPSRNRATGGAGLGLAIVRRLAEAQGGSVTVDSEGEGRGSTFAIQLGSPIPQADQSTSRR